MQIALFETGGFVIHKIKIPGRTSKFSAWFDRNRKLVYCQRVDRSSRVFPIRGLSPVWWKLQLIGKHLVMEGLSSAYKHMEARERDLVS